PYDRATRVTVGVGLTGSENAVTEMSYPTAFANESRVSKQLDATRWLAYKTTYDGFGRPLTANAAEDGNHASFANFTIFSKRVYDGLGRVKFATNPYRGSGGAATDGGTRTAYDLAGRLIDVATFSGGPDSPPPDYPATSGGNSLYTGSVMTTYASEVTTVRDQAGKQRRSTVDGLGLLTRVEEMEPSPSTTVYATTTYGYDARGNLKTVSQGAGQQTRNFSYDGLSRLVSAFNPESGAVNYQYDLASNLITKTDARVPAVVTTYGYDALNRVRTRSYSDATPLVTYNYDTAANGVGRLASVTSAVSSHSYTSYDAFGRVTAYNQATDGHLYTMSAAYNKAGLVTDETYPSLRVVHTEYDGAGRIAGVRNQATGAYYAGGASGDAVNRIQYTAHGAVSAMKLGNSLWEHTMFNSRLQPTQIGLGTAASGAGSTSVLGLDYEYGGSDNNGNVQSQTITVGANVMVQSYGYDRVNRLTLAKESVGAVVKWQQDFAYDLYGNRTSLVHSGADAGFLPAPSAPPVNPANNRFTTFGYDAAGNVTTDGNGNTFTYNGENKQVSFTPAGGVGQSAVYSYDGDGHRVKKVVAVGASAVTTIFVYNAAGQMLAEYTTPEQPVQGGGGVSYLTVDHLGSTRVVTNSAGGVKSRYDYLPFGQELSDSVSGRTTAMGYNAADSLRQKFTSKERDSESGLDYFFARYYSSAHGRFTSVDPLMANSHPGRPQGWNRYAYAFNNPLRFIDPDGQDPEDENIHKIKTTTTTEVTVQERGGGGVVQQATITITETQTQYVNDNGDVVQTDPVQTSATAVNTGNAPIPYSEAQLKTMANVAQNIVEVSRAKNFDPTIALGIARTETHMGTLQSQEASPAKQSPVNPMQLSSTSGIKPTTNLRSNISGAIDVYNRGAGSTLNASLQTYNNEAGRAAYARTAEGHINNIRSSTSQTVLRVNNWNLRDYRPPRVGPFPNSGPYKNYR
ncbi:MAG TPA: RHS repeat-associated core domain-containing protein, partial [Blastocatellia bacterium]|nr:RHS repeat-associated core domain-containing protein [Blastocatellia bacterium]